MKFNIVFIWAITTFCISQDLTPEAVLDSMTAIMSPDNAKGKMQQIIKTSGGKIRLFEYNYYSGNKGENILMRYIKPRKIKGNAFLLKNHSDDIWIYFPRTRRVKKLASHAKKQKVQGSDFSYEDFSGSDQWKEDYNITLKDGDREHHVLKLVPKKDTEPSYTQMILHIRRSDFLPSKIDYYDENGLLKTLSMDDIKTIEDIPTAMTMKMENHIEGTETVMKVLEMTYSVEFEKDFFTERTLKK